MDAYTCVNDMIYVLTCTCLNAYTCVHYHEHRYVEQTSIPGIGSGAQLNGQLYFMMYCYVQG